MPTPWFMAPGSHISIDFVSMLLLQASARPSVGLRHSQNDAQRAVRSLPSLDNTPCYFDVDFIVGMSSVSVNHATKQPIYLACTMVFRRYLYIIKQCATNPGKETKSSRFVAPSYTASVVFVFLSPTGIAIVAPSFLRVLCDVFWEVADYG